MPRKKTKETGFAAVRELDEKSRAGKKAPKKRVSPRKVAKGIANTSEAPGGFRRFFRFSQLAVGEAGAGRKIEDIWATFLKELEDLGIPAESRSRLESLGATKVFGKSGLGKAVIASAGGTENVTAIKETLKAAKVAVKGLNPKALEAEWTSLLKRLATDEQFSNENGRRILAELKKLDPKVVARVGSNQVMSVLARRGDDPFFMRLFNKAMRRPGTATLPEGITNVLADISGGKLPKIAGSTTKALAGTGLAGGVGRKALGLLGKSGLGALGVGAVAAFEFGRARDILGREGRAKKLALTGIEGLGPSSSVDFLRDIVSKQEAVARRKVTMQQFEPDLFQEVVRVLSDTSQSTNSLTSTERRIGSDAQLGVQRRGRSANDVQFLLDELFNQMNQG